MLAQLEISHRAFIAPILPRSLATSIYGNNERFFVQRPPTTDRVIRRAVKSAANVTGDMTHRRAGRGSAFITRLLNYTRRPRSGYCYGARAADLRRRELLPRCLSPNLLLLYMRASPRLAYIYIGAVSGTRKMNAADGVCAALAENAEFACVYEKGEVVYIGLCHLPQR